MKTKARKSVVTPFARGSIWNSFSRLYFLYKQSACVAFSPAIADLIRLKIDRCTQLYIDTFAELYSSLLHVYFYQSNLFFFSSKIMDEFIVMKTVQQSRSRHLHAMLFTIHASDSCAREIFFNYPHIFP